MKQMIRIADSKGRVALPGFANATLIVEQIDATEYRIRKAKVIAEKDLTFQEEQFPVELTEREALQLLEALEKPPKPNAAARQAAKEFVKGYERVGHREVKKKS